VAGYRSPLAGGRWHSPKQLDERVREGEQMINDKCDKCENMARITVSGFTPYKFLCARHCAELCLSHNDMAGFDKFTALIEGDRVAI
jgi:hypothetical protein